ncbi:MAG: hypothetical protein HZB40_10795 [Rhodocyclales bacterium]|nr:hypothetical protein [Rhodocyclales bacterium]
MTRKTVDFTKSGIAGLSKDKPALYTIETAGGRTNYIGIAQRGRVAERLAEHLPGARDAVPGAKVRVEPMPSIAEARAREARAIARVQPKYNKQGK